jgi:hypothetical protein
MRSISLAISIPRKPLLGSTVEPGPHQSHDRIEITSQALTLISHPFQIRAPSLESIVAGRSVMTLVESWMLLHMQHIRT